MAIALLSASCEKKVDEASAEVPGENLSPAASPDNHPMKTCPVSGEELGSMGEPVIVEHDGTTVKLCCKSCIKDFNADPEKFTAMVMAAGNQ